MAEKKMVPAVRFAEFTDAWEQRKVGEFANVLSASRVHKDEWVTSGVPFYRSSDVVSAFKGNDNERAFISIELYKELVKVSGKLEKDDILITGGGSIGIPFIVPNSEPLYSKDADLIWIKRSEEHDSAYLYAYFASHLFREFIGSISHVGTIAHYTIEQVKDTPVRLPSIAEQRAIGSFFHHLDHLITLHQRKCEKLKNIKKSMLEKMFPREGASVPEIRFAEFTDAWEQRKLEELAEEITRNDPTSDAPIMMITANSGFIEQSDRYAFDNAGESLKKYILLRKGELAYNHGASKLRPYGSCFALTTTENARIPFVYHCFSVGENDPEFMSIELNGAEIESQLRRIVSSGARMDGLLNISFDEYTSVSVFLPSIAEQKKISTFFRNLDHLITLHQRKLEKLQSIKKSMLEKMFV